MMSSNNQDTEIAKNTFKTRSAIGATGGGLKKQQKPITKIISSARRYLDANKGFMDTVRRSANRKISSNKSGKDYHYS
jgi:hypothetical protein